MPPSDIAARIARRLPLSLPLRQIVRMQANPMIEPTGPSCSNVIAGDDHVELAELERRINVGPDARRAS